MHMKDLDAAIESLGFQLSPLEAFVEAELARTKIGGEPIIKTQEEAYTEVKTSGTLKDKGREQQPSDTQHQPEDDALFKELHALGHTIVQSGERQGIPAEPTSSTSITAAPRVPIRSHSSWTQREHKDSGSVPGPYPIFDKPEPRFYEGHQVHMSEKKGSTRMKGSYLISKSRFSRSKGYTKYQLLEPLTQLLHNEGAWYREKDLMQGS
ncbi:hypothetical protein HBH56_196590 [Parastagonospora nodorum]|uniref:Uncharacterized protein n=2 Tax=Phaeosphaeria nodorum (strain SN15 / ATCC MYA-4574 / FGSC 10173) TaxID=321614 RepID=A0A7U2FAD5_PHANO|nr:hypothetical protein SNOG_09171 [Parastagonospora nodorum SN15]KAH3907143.1 hypothetical protein HBH56_196590 [Parastagonospora nodorum]EAT83363.1 hypothetical protein SNOG_09171 [Parastagonospora nodorum SN15]KAH3953234.1 hypothetical protein HBH53_039040 [Parastagonospora nodorum]KAH4151257.1 hypothetical protein HBH44_168940 [Parastagonospora nodorum]KAH4274250.1 hypothetical protein HBI03_002800 [Parastagonospora nodorum]